MGDTLDPSTSDNNSVLPGNGMDIAGGDATLESESSTSTSTSFKKGRISLVRYIGLGLLGASIIAGIFVFLEQSPKNQSTVNARLSSSAEQRFNVQTIPSSSLNGLSSSTSIASSPTLSINGKLQANNSVVIAPTSQPTNAVAGQVYYDKTTNQLGYYNGSSFAYLGGNQTSVTSLGGASGILTVGVGLNQTGNQLTNSGVLSLQGQIGNVTLVGGSGISISGTQFTNTGVLAIGGQVGSINLGNGLNISSGTLENSGILSITSDTPSLVVSNDGSGNITLTTNGAGTGTVSSVGGIAGQIAEFTGAQTIADSLLNQSGTTITDNGSLSITGGLTLGTALSTNNGGTGATTPSGARSNIGAAASGTNSDITSLSGLTTALSVLQGGTGTTTLTANGILLGNGSNPVTSLTSGSAGLCLISGAGAPSWQSCPGGGGVVSINNQSGTVSIASATGSGSVITINNASTSQLGLAEFNSSDFSVSSGIVDTIQPINTSASPTFGQLSLTSAQAAATMAVINNTNTSATGNLISLQLNGVNKFTVGPGGNVVANGTITSSTINGQTVSNAASFTGSLAVAGTANLNGGANVTGVLGVNTITPSSNLTVGSTAQSFTLQGSSSSTITATGGGFTTNIGFTGSPTGTVTYNFDRSAVAGTYTICTTTGNCAGVGGGVTSSGGTTGNIPVFTGGNTITNSSLSDNGTTVTTTEALTVQGSTATVGVPNVRTGTLQLAYGGANFSASITPGGLTANRTYTLPDASGTVCLSSGNCLGGGSGGANSSLSNLSSVAINTSLLPGTNTIDLGSSSAPFRNLFLSGSSASPATSNFSITGTPTAARTLTLPDATGTICLATSSACGFATGSGAAFLQNGNSFGSTANIGTNDSNSLDLITNGSARVTIDASGNTTFNNNVTLGGGTLSSTGALAITPGGALTIGAANQTFTLQGNSSSTISATSGANTTSLAFVAPTASVTYRLQAASAGTYDLCTTAGNCVGLGGGVTASGATSGTIAAFTGSSTIANSLLSESGSTVAVNGNLNLTSGNLFEINGSQISSANLSDGSNLAKLNAAQTFTGATNTFSGNVAVNGGTLSSTGALAITPGGGLTVGATGQTLTLQGNSNSTLTGTSGINTTTLAFQTPTANVTYNLPTASAGTYSLCSTAGNCAGVGGGVTTAGGTTGTIPVFTSGSGIGNSLLSQSGSTVTAGGNLNLTSGNNYEINGSQIASSNLSDGANLAKLNSAQTFTAANIIQANSATAFAVQNTSGYSMFNVNSTTGNTTLGNITSAAGQGVAGNLTLADGTNDNFGATLNTTTLTANQTVTLPNASGTVCLSSGNCLGGGSGGANTALSNLSNVAINSSLLPGTASIDLGSAGNPFRNLILSGTGTAGALLAKSNSTTAFQVQNAGSAPLFTADTTDSLVTTSGNAMFQGTTTLEDGTNAINAFQVQNASAGSLLTGDTTNMRLGVNVTYANMGVPTTLAVGGSILGGSLTASTTYYYEVSALDSAGGQTTVSNQASGATGNTHKTLPLTWAAVTGASAYDIYRCIGGSGCTEDYLTTVLTNSYTDAGTSTPSSVTAPTTNTAYVSTNISNNDLQLSIGGNGTPTGQVYVSGQLQSTATGSAATSSTPTAVAVVGSYEYVASNGGNTLQVFNVANPADPILVSTFTLTSSTFGGGQAYSMVVQGKYAYIGNGDLLEVVNISNPFSPSEVSHVATEGDASTAIYVQGKYAYVGSWNTGGFEIFDISNPAAPVSVSWTTYSGSGLHTSSMYVQGNYMYAMTQTAGLEIYNVSNPSSPTNVSTTNPGGLGFNSRAYIQGSYIYATNPGGNDIQILNISNPASVTTTNSSGWSTGASSSPTGIYVQGRYAYVTLNGTNKLAVYDVSNPTNPILVSSSATGTAPASLTVNGRYAYVLNSTSATTQIFDLGGEYAQQLEAGGIVTSTLQANGDSTLNGNVNITGGLNLQASATINGDLGISGNTFIQGTLAVAGSIQGGATINGLSTPGAPTVTPTGTTGATNYSYEVAAVSASGGITPASSAGSSAAGNATLTSGNYNNITWSAVSGAVSYNIYRTVGGSAQGLIGNTSAQTLNDTGLAATTAAPTTDSSGQLTVNGTATFKNTTNSTTAFQIQNAAGASLLAADTLNSRITVGNIGTASDQLYVGGLIPTTPTSTYGSTIPLGGHMSIVGNYLYSTESNGAKLDTFDVSNPTSPTELANTSIGVTGSNVIVQGHYAYVDGYHGPSTVAFNIIDVSKPAAPVSLSTLSIPGLSQVGVMSIQGNYAYFESNDGTNDYLDIVDISNPSNPVLAEAYTLNTNDSSVWDMTVRSHYLYIAYNVTSGTAFQIIDVSNPTSPTVISSMSAATSGSLGLYEPEAMAFNGRYLYIANQTNNAWVVDISNPASPSLVGSAFTPGGTSTLRALVQGQRLYLENTGGSTVTVFDISNPTSPTNLGSLSTPGNATDIEIAGTYLYSSGYFVTPSLKIYNLGGTYTQNLQTGDLATGGLQVANGATIGGNINAQGGIAAQSLSIQGASGFGGTAMFTSTVTQRNATNSTTALQIQNAAGTSILTADTTDGSIGIGGSGSSTSRLIVTGVDSASSNYSLTVNNSAGTAIGQFRDDGTVTLGAGSSGFFGNDATGPADTSDNYSNLMVGSQFTTSTNPLNITSVSVYINSPIQNSPDNQYQVGIYTDSGNKPSTWVAGSAATTITGNSWNTASVTATLSANTKYWLVYTTNTTNNGNNTLDVATSTSTTYAFSSAFTFGSGTNSGLPTTFPSPSTTNHMMSIYATTSNSYSPAFVVGADGNVGIGIGSSTSPTANLEVKTPTNTTTAFQVQNAGGAALFTADTTNSAIVLGADTTPGNITVRGGVASGSNVSGGNITFQASNGTGAGGSGSFAFQTGVPQGGSIGVDNHAETTTVGASTTMTLSYTTGSEANRLMVVETNDGCDNGPTSVTYDGTNLTQLSIESSPGVKNGGYCASTQMWYLVNPTSGTGNLVVNLASSNGSVGVSTFYNVSQTAPFGTVATANGSTTGTQSTALSVSATSTSQIVVDDIAIDNDCSSLGGPASGQTLLWQYQGCTGLFSTASSYKQGASGTVNMSWSVTSADWAGIGVAINPAPTGTATTTDTMGNTLAIGNNGVNIQDASANGLFSANIANDSVNVGANTSASVVTLQGGLTTTATINGSGLNVTSSASTIGNVTTIGAPLYDYSGNVDSSNSNMLSATEVGTTAAGYVNTIRVHIHNADVGNNAHMSVGLYTNNPGGSGSGAGYDNPGSLMANSSSVALTANDTWVTFTIPNTTVSASTDYWIAFNTDDGNVSYNWTNGDGVTLQNDYSNPVTFGTWTGNANPWSSQGGGGFGDGYAVNMDVVGDTAGQTASLLNVNGTSDIVNLGATGITSLSSTVNVATSIGAPQTVHIADSSFETSTVGIGSGYGTSATTIQSGTGNLTLQTGSSGGNSGSIFIQSGSAGEVAGNVVIDTGHSSTSTGANIENDNFETGTDNWTSDYNTGTLAQSSTYHVSGSNSLTFTTSGGWEVASNWPGDPGVTPGDTYQVSIWVRSALTENITFALDWHTANQGWINGATVEQTNDSTSGWTQYTGYVTAPANAYYVQLVVDGNTSGDTVYLDDAVVTGSSTAPLVSIGASNAAGVTIGNTSAAGGVLIQGGSDGVDLATASGNTIKIGADSNDIVKIGSSTGTEPLTLQGSGITQTITGNGSTPSDIIQTSTNSTTAFQIQNSSGASGILFTADTTNSVIDVSGTTSTFATLEVNNGHFESVQGTKPTIGMTTCVGSPALNGSSTAASTDSAGSLTTGNLTTGGSCAITVTYNKPYASAPKAVLVTPLTSNAPGVNAYVSNSGTNSFTITFQGTASTSNTYQFYYWVVE